MQSPASVILVCVAGIVGLIIWCYDWNRAGPKYDLKFNSSSVEGTAKVFITAEELQRMMESEEGVTLLDARNQESAIARGLSPDWPEKIPGAYIARWKDFVVPGTRDTLLPVSELERRFRERGVCNSVPVVVYGSWTEAWGEEGRIFWQLDWLNHKQAYILYGGIYAWTDISCKRCGRRGPGDFAAHPVDSRLINADKIVKTTNSKSDSLLLLDVRTEAEYTGAHPYGAKRGGHIPAAVSYEWKNVFISDGSGNLKNQTQLRAELKELGLKDGMSIAAYCTGGIRSGFMYSVLRWLGYKNIANYAGSWWDWAGRTYLPISAQVQPSFIGKGIEAT